MSHSSKHPFDTMFVIICVIAGASSHTISNTSRITPIYQSHNRYKTSFIDLILDTGLTKFLHTSKMDSSNEPNSIANLHQSQSFNVRSSNVDLHQQQSSVCSYLSNILGGSQIKFCYKHENLLKLVLPQVMELTKKECVRITADLRWTCTTLDPFLDRSSSLSFTREAALIRSILNASMMYLIVKTCGDHNHPSCGCESTQRLAESPNSIPESELGANSPNDGYPMSNLIIDQIPLNRHELTRLETGSPLRLSKSMVQHQGCNANIAFADALTRILFDADDTKSLNKAQKVLNENYNNNRSNKYSGEKRIVDSDYRDLSFIKWTKSAVNLHNNHVGRQIARGATQRQCRCHGISGACQFQTCWDSMLEFSSVAFKLREVYLNNSFSVRSKNLGSYEKPDLYLAKSNSIPKDAHLPINSINGSIRLQEKTQEPYPYRLKSHELAFFHESPDYCDVQPNIDHPGTKERQCTPSISDEKISIQHKLGTTIDRRMYPNQPPGSCEYLCCNRGFNSELVLYVVKCDCGFKFCCKVECNDCLRQRMQHYCL